MTDNTEHFDIELLKSGIDVLDIGGISDIQIEKFTSFTRLLLEWNEKMNLTSITDSKDIIIKHYLDSLSVLKQQNITDTDKHIIDVGTGAGFPGIPLAIMCERATIVLMDSTKKRLNFLEAAISELSLDNVTVLWGRAEDLSKKAEYRGRFDIAISRAVANLAALSEYCIPFIKINGCFIAMKGIGIESEVEQAQFIIKDLGAKIISISEIELPHSNIRHSLIYSKKFRQTPSKYPRNQAQILKSPVK